jgi:hypothetical protein
MKLKKVLFIVLVFLLPIIFLLQAGLGFKEDFIFLPLKLLPLPLYLYIVLKFGKKHFTYKFLSWDYRKVIAGFVFCNLLFQYQFVYKVLPVLKLSNTVFATHYSHKINTLESRMIVSFSSAINFLPLFGDWKRNREFIDRVRLSSVEVFYIKNITQEQGFKEICQIVQFNNIGDCGNNLIYDYMSGKEVDTTLGVLLTAVGAMNIFNSKEKSSHQDDLAKFNSNAISSIQLIEVTNRISLKMRDHVLHLEGDSYARTVEQEIYKKFSKTTKEKIGDLIKNLEKAYATPNRKIATNDLLRTRFNQAKKVFESFHQLTTSSKDMRQN